MSKNIKRIQYWTLLNRDAILIFIIALVTIFGIVIYLNSRYVHEKAYVSAIQRKQLKDTADYYRNKVGQTIVKLVEKTSIVDKTVYQKEKIDSLSGVIKRRNEQIANFKPIIKCVKDSFPVYISTTDTAVVHIYVGDGHKAIKLHDSIVIPPIISIPKTECREYSKGGIGVGVGYDPFTNKPTISIGVNLNIIQFKKKKHK